MEEKISEEVSKVLLGVLFYVEYAAYNLCEKEDSDVGANVVESSCPEASLFLAIRELKKLVNRV